MCTSFSQFVKYMTIKILEVYNVVPPIIPFQMSCSLILTSKLQNSWMDEQFSHFKIKVTQNLDV